MKRSGFSVKITAFKIADPKDMPSMADAMRTVESLSVMMKEQGFIALEIDQRFMLTKDIPDPAPVAEPDHGGIFGNPAPVPEQPHPLDIPASLDRRGKA